MPHFSDDAGINDYLNDEYHRICLEARSSFFPRPMSYWEAVGIDAEPHVVADTERVPDTLREMVEK